MADTVSKETRSAIMRAVTSKGNKSTEGRLIALFRETGVTGWRRTMPLFGAPDFVFRAKKTVVFVDGCFWHGHDCRGVTPSSNRAYWRKKIERNKARDKTVSRYYRKEGWNVIRIWECEFKSGKAKRKIMPLQ